MSKDFLRDASNAILFDHYSKAKYIETWVKLVVSLGLGIGGTVMVVYYFGWKLWFGIMLLMFGHNIEHHWPKRDIVADKMKEKFLTDLMDDDRPRTERGT